MMTYRRASTRGCTTLAWLDSRHTFSFGKYYNAAHMGFRSLRVINEYHLQPGQGLGTHGHTDMEILTYVLSGSLEHQDSLGRGSVIAPGDGQRLSAGTGIRHSEYNHSATEPVHFLQFWIFPEHNSLIPSYEHKALPLEDKRGRLRLLVSRDGREGTMTVHQDVDLYVAVLEPGERVSHALRPGRHAWLQVACGTVALHGLMLPAGDGMAVSDEAQIDIQATAPAEILLFDLA